jgi:NADPH:quinone reductase
VPRVSGSITIDAPAAATWTVIRDFNGLPRWLPFVAASEIEGGGPADRVGAVRKLTLADGGTTRESLLEHSDDERSMKYDIVESALPVREYVGTARVIADGDDRSILEWTSEWENDPEVEDEMIELLGNELMPAGLAAAKAAIEGRAAS